MTGVARRDFLIAAGGALVPWLARAQTKRVFNVGALVPMAGLAAQPYLSALRERLDAHGFVEGRNLRIAVRHASNPPMEAGDLVAAAPDALFACTAPLARALTQATQSIPIVFAWVADPVHAGLVQSYARPGANVTGVANRYAELAQKRVELLHELLPAARRVSVLAGVFDETMEDTLRHARIAAQRLGIAFNEAHTCAFWTEELGEALVSSADAIMAITPFAAYGTQWISEDLARFSIARRLPVVFSDLESVALGGLVSYGNSFIGDVRHAAGLLGQVLEGAKPAEVPVELAARFELAVNLRTARAIGVEVPQSILLRADRVID